MYEIIRIIRNLTRYYFDCQEDYITVHASSVDYKGKAIAIIGPKMSGKTSLAINLLTNHKCVFITNDVLTINLITGECFGWPIAPSIRFGTLKCYDYLSNYVYNNNLEYYYPYISSTLNDFENINDPNWEKKKFRFTPKEFVKIFDSDICYSSFLELAICPKYLTTKAVSFTTLNEIEITQMFRSNIEKIKFVNSETTKKKIDMQKKIKAFKVVNNESIEKDVTNTIIEHMKG